MTERLNPTTRTARSLAREQLTAQIVASARTQLGTVGAAALSVRAVARDVGMVSSAVYRYFPSRDALLTALITACYEELAAAVERAETAAPRGDLPGRWLALAHAVRAWALDHPFDWALLYGSPVPGYRAPESTTEPGTRVSRRLLGLLAEAGPELTPPAPSSGVDPELPTVLAALSVVDGRRLPDELAVRGLMAWSGLIGAVSLELFGQFGDTITDPDRYFTAVASRLSPFAA